MSLEIEFNWHGLQKQLMEFGYQHCKISVVGAHTGFDWDALTDEVIVELDYMHENGESLIYKFSPLWAKDGNPKIFVPDDDVWALKRYEVWCYHLPEEARRSVQDFTPLFEGSYAGYEKALAEAAALYRKGYYEISINRLSDDGCVHYSYEQEEWTEHCWHSELEGVNGHGKSMHYSQILADQMAADADGSTSDGLAEMKVPYGLEAQS
tara:strand:- start:1191 stop:1817 length:627 start_codon:yes stop_codon:yes gene_type:complete